MNTLRGRQQAVMADVTPAAAASLHNDDALACNQHPTAQNDGANAAMVVDSPNKPHTATKAGQQHTEGNYKVSFAQAALGLAHENAPAGKGGGCRRRKRKLEAMYFKSGISPPKQKSARRCSSQKSSNSTQAVAFAAELEEENTSKYTWHGQPEDVIVLGDKDHHRGAVMEDHDTRENKRVAAQQNEDTHSKGECVEDIPLNGSMDLNPYERETTNMQATSVLRRHDPMQQDQGNAAECDLGGITVDPVLDHNRINDIAEFRTHCNAPAMNPAPVRDGIHLEVTPGRALPIETCSIVSHVTPNVSPKESISRNVNAHQTQVDADADGPRITSTAAAPTINNCCIPDPDSPSVGAACALGATLAQLTNGQDAASGRNTTSASCKVVPEVSAGILPGQPSIPPSTTQHSARIMMPRCSEAADAPPVVPHTAAAAAADGSSNAPGRKRLGESSEGDAHPDNALNGSHDDKQFVVANASATTCPKGRGDPDIPTCSAGDSDGRTGSCASERGAKIAHSMNEGSAAAHPATQSGYATQELQGQNHTERIATCQLHDHLANDTTAQVGELPPAASTTSSPSNTENNALLDLLLALTNPLGQVNAIRNPPTPIHCAAPNMMSSAATAASCLAPHIQGAHGIAPAAPNAAAPAAPSGQVPAGAASIDQDALMGDITRLLLLTTNSNTFAQGAVINSMVGSRPGLPGGATAPVPQPAAGAAAKLGVHSSAADPAVSSNEQLAKLLLALSTTGDSTNRITEAADAAVSVPAASAAAPLAAGVSSFSVNPPAGAAIDKPASVTADHTLLKLLFALSMTNSSGNATNSTTATAVDDDRKLKSPIPTSALKMEHGLNKLLARPFVAQGLGALNPLAATIAAAAAVPGLTSAAVTTAATHSTANLQPAAQGAAAGVPWLSFGPANDNENALRRLLHPGLSNSGGKVAAAAAGLPMIGEWPGLLGLSLADLGAKMLLAAGVTTKPAVAATGTATVAPAGAPARAPHTAAAVPRTLAPPELSRASLNPVCTTSTAPYTATSLLPSQSAWGAAVEASPTGCGFSLHATAPTTRASSRKHRNSGRSGHSRAVVNIASNQCVVGGGGLLELEPAGATAMNIGRVMAGSSQHTAASRNPHLAWEEDDTILPTAASLVSPAVLPATPTAQTSKSHGDPLKVAIDAARACNVTQPTSHTDAAVDTHTAVQTRPLGRATSGERPTHTGKDFMQTWWELDNPADVDACQDVVMTNGAFERNDTQETLGPHDTPPQGQKDGNTPQVGSSAKQTSNNPALAGQAVDGGIHCGELVHTTCPPLKTVTTTPETAWGSHKDSFTDTQVSRGEHNSMTPDVTAGNVNTNAETPSSLPSNNLPRTAPGAPGSMAATLGGKSNTVLAGLAGYDPAWGGPSVADQPGGLIPSHTSAGKGQRGACKHNLAGSVVSAVQPSRTSTFNKGAAVQPSTGTFNKGVGLQPSGTLHNGAADRTPATTTGQTVRDPDEVIQGLLSINQQLCEAGRQLCDDNHKLLAAHNELLAQHARLEADYSQARQQLCMMLQQPQHTTQHAVQLRSQDKLGPLLPALDCSMFPHLPTMLFTPAFVAPPQTNNETVRQLPSTTPPDTAMSSFSPVCTPIANADTSSLHGNMLAFGTPHGSPISLPPITCSMPRIDSIAMFLTPDFPHLGGNSPAETPRTSLVPSLPALKRFDSFSTLVLDHEIQTLEATTPPNTPRGGSSPAGPTQLHQLPEVPSVGQLAGLDTLLGKELVDGGLED